MPFVSRKNSQSIAIKLITREALQNQKKRSSEHDWLKTNGFEGKPGTTCFVPKPAQGQVRLFVGVKESKKLGDREGYQNSYRLGSWRISVFKTQKTCQVRG